MATPRIYRKCSTGAKYESLVFYLWKFYKNKIENEIPQHMLDDLMQELRLISLEVENLEEKEAYKAINRLIYRFLVKYGYKRPSGAKLFIHSSTQLAIVADSILP
jgi:hypothetical protein